MSDVIVNQSAASIRAQTRADDAAADNYAANRKLHAIIQTAIDAIKRLGPMDHCMTPGHDLGDIEAALVDLLPDLSDRNCVDVRDWFRDREGV